MIVPEQSTESCSTVDVGVRWSRRVGNDQPVAEALMVPLVVIVCGEFRERPSQVGFAEDHEATEALLFNRADEALRVCITLGARYGVCTTRIPTSANV